MLDIKFIRENPEKKEAILTRKGILESLFGLLKRIFPARSREEDALSVDSLKASVLELKPAVEEVNELREGILKDYQDIY